MWKRMTAAVLVLPLPGSVSAGPLREAIDKAGRAGRRQSKWNNREAAHGSGQVLPSLRVGG